MLYHSEGRAVGGLTDGQAYYVIKTDKDHFQLAASAADAKAGTAVDLTSVGSGTQHLSAGVAPLTASASTVSTSTDSFIIKNHSLKTGDSVVYRTEGAAVGGL